MPCSGVISALGLALLAAIEPIGVIAFIAVLGTRGGRRNTRGFIVGWTLSACVVAVVTIVASEGSRSGHAATLIGSAGLLQIALGVSALAYLVQRRRRDPAARERADKASLDGDTLGPVGAAFIGAGVQGWPVIAAAVSAVLRSTDTTTGRLLGVSAVVLVSTSTYAVAHVLAGREPERTAAWLGNIKRKIEAHRETVIDYLVLGAGAYLVIHGVLAQIAK